MKRLVARPAAFLAALALATCKAAGDRSIAITSMCGNSWARVTAMQPLPVPTAMMTGRNPFWRSFKASSITPSVSGRGIRTDGVT